MDNCVFPGGARCGRFRGLVALQRSRYLISSSEKQGGTDYLEPERRLVSLKQQYYQLCKRTPT